MTPELMLKALDARGQKLAQAGHFDAFVANDAKAAGLRQQVRTQVLTKALQRYETDQDPAALAQTIYNDGIFDGKTITKSDLVKGGQGGLKGAPSGPDVIRFTLSDGSVKLVDPNKVPEQAMKMLQDPATQRELMMFEGKERLKAALEQKNQSHKHGLTMKEIEARGNLKLDEAAVRGETARDVAETRAVASEYSADRRREATITASQIRASAASARSAVGPGGAGKAPYVKSTKTLGDGRIMAVMSDGSGKIMTHDNGKPMSSIDYERLVGQTAGQVGNSLSGMTMTPEQQRTAGRSMLPQPPQPGSTPQRLRMDINGNPLP